MVIKNRELKCDHLTKVCKKCNIKKNTIEFYSMKNTCKQCISIYQKKHDEIRRMKVCKNIPNFKKCINCRKIKNIECYGINNRNSDKHNNKCKECMKEYYLNKKR